MPAQRKFFTDSFLKLLTTYTIVFIVFYTLYTALNWFLIVRLHVPVSGELVDFWIPCILGFIISYFYLTPIVKRLKIRKNAASALNWFILPVTLGLAVTFSQNYYKDRSYS